MINIIQADLYKLKKSKPIKILFLIMWAAAAIVTFVSYLVAQGKIGMEISGPISGLSDVMTIAIVGPFLAGIYICSDFSNKSINDTISSCGMGRGVVIISKAIVLYLLVLLMILPYAVVTIIAFATGAEFSEPFSASVFLHILANQTDLSLTGAVIGKILVIMFVMTLAYASQMSIGIILAFVLRKTSLVIFLGFGIILVLQILGGIGTEITAIEKFLSITPFSVNNQVLAMDSEVSDILKAIGVCFLFIVWMLSIANGAFKKSEIK
ncbi:hypothetical protein [Bacillus sp. JCM 19034]|uniref:hypothetical protein n=1 Tax=Bacillus sp. JCM 19034 TaxID=1481928 RepID=UPI000785B937|nr:hypothetical protein [Bacillus sp. JCM 19034]